MVLDLEYQLNDRFKREEWRVYLTGTDALVRLCLEQGRCDQRSGANTAGFVTGYRGSPLGTFDLALSRARHEIERANVQFEPGLNEDLAATALWGTQQSSLMPDATVAGVFGLWYGKGPGVDRSTDALKHANFAGVAPRGGIVLIAGDDPGAKSSSLAHQSEPVLAHCGIPVFSPSSHQEFITFGLAGWAASRYSGSWISLRCPTDLVDSAGTVDLDAVTRRWKIPEEQLDEDRFISWARPALEQADQAENPTRGKQQNQQQHHPVKKLACAVELAKQFGEHRDDYRADERSQRSTDPTDEKHREQQDHHIEAEDFRADIGDVMGKHRSADRGEHG